MKKLTLIVLLFILLFNIVSFSDTSANVTSEGTIVTTDGSTGNFGWVEENGNWRFIEKDGEYAVSCMKKSNNNTYYINDEGYMAYDYLYKDDRDNIYYFSETGAMVTHLWVAIPPDKIEEEKWNAEYYWMYFQDNGKAIKGKDGEGKKKTIEGKTYFFDEDGVMLTGWISANGEHLDSENSDDWYSENAMYYAGEDGALISGWLKWEDTNKEGDNDLRNIKDDYIDLDYMYFYFSPSSFKKLHSEEKTINGRLYRFAIGTGRMLVQWEEAENVEERRRGAYTPLLYIESYGNNPGQQTDESSPWIDSLYYHNANSEVKLDFTLMNQYSTFRCIYGSRQTTAHATAFYISVKGREFGANVGNVLDDHTVAFPESDFGNTRYVATLNKSKVTIDYANDGTNLKTVSKNGTLTSYTGRTDPIFCTADQSRDHFEMAALRLYELTISENGKVIKHFIPCELNKDTHSAYPGDDTIYHRDEYGLWETVENKFYPRKNPDSNAFLPGPEIFTDYRYHYDKSDGSVSKNQWIYDVPTPLLSEEDYDEQNKQWFYSNTSGMVLLDQEKKINNKTYLFDKNGIMQTNLIVKFAPSTYKIVGYNTNYYIMRVDLDSTSASDFIKRGVFYMKDKPIPFDMGVDVTFPGHEDEPLYRENCIKMITTGNHIPYNIFYFGDDGAKRIGEDIKVNFGDETYTFASKADGAFYGFHGSKYYQNGFLCNADPDIGYGILVDYNVLDYTTLGSTVLTKLRSLDSMFYNYNNYIVEKEGESAANTRINTLIESNNKLNKYYLHYPVLSSLTKGVLSASEMPAGSDATKIGTFNATNMKNCLYVVDKKGKKKKKGRYLDRQGNHWLIDKNNELVGIFTVPVKWGTVDGKEAPMYKSTFYETNSKGEQIEKEKYMPFFTRDAAGNTELDYVYEIDDEYIVNATIGEYKMGMN